MLDEEKANKLMEKYYNRFRKFNTDVLIKLGETIKQFDGLTPSQAYELGQELKYGYTVDELANELSKITNMTVEDVYKMFDKIAEQGTAFAEVYYKAKELEYTPYKENGELQRYVESLAGETTDFINIINSKNIGFSLYNKDTGKYEFVDIESSYNNLIDEAVFKVSSGVEDYQSAMRRTMKQLASSGVKVNEYKLSYGDYNIRLDSAIRQHILDGLRDVNQGIQDRIGKELGTDGVEISAHELCAADHLDYQGRQFTNEEFKEIQKDLARPIGEYNCKHFVFNIILGVQEQNYSDKLLNEYRNNSLEKIEYEGKSYTRYEATQVQRRLETQIRKWKDKQIIARASGDKDGVSVAQSNISTLTSKYNDFSKNAGLDTYKNRLSVSGYKRVNAAKIK